ncbi:MAG: sterol desaturase family protein [Bacteroidota bacterium]
MLPLWLNIFIFLAAFFGMEGMAWFSHKYIMHGFMWRWHKSHHHPYNGILEKNDLFSLVFSIPAIACFWAGYKFPHLAWLTWLGAGITGYGIFYFIFHDVIVHRRVKHGYRAGSSYMKRLIRAHKVHHKYTEKDGAEAFGFLFAPKKYEVKDYSGTTVRKK